MVPATRAEHSKAVTANHEPVNFKYDPKIREMFMRPLSCKRMAKTKLIPIQANRDDHLANTSHNHRAILHHHAILYDKLSISVTLLCAQDYPWTQWLIS